MVTSKDVAKSANVSISTVSRVFSNPSLVNEETIEKIKRIAEELNYFPNTAAKSLKLNITNNIGVVISDINNPFYIHILKEMSNNSLLNNYRFLIAFSEETEYIEYDRLSSLVASKVDALVFTPIGIDNNKIQKMITDNDVVSLQLYRNVYKNIDSLTIDDEYGTYLATKELLDNGHTNIVLIDYLLAIPTNRNTGYIRAYKEYGIEYNPNNIITLDITADYENELFKKLDDINPTAIIPSSYIFANSTFSYLQNRNKKIKDDISLLIYDDNEIAKFMNISVISHPIKEIADKSSMILANRLKDHNLDPQHLVIKPFLIKRDSIKNLKH